MFLVAISKPSQELYACQQLTNQGAQCYLPMCLEDRSVKQKSEPRLIPLLKRYFLFDPCGIPVRTVLNTRGIASIVKQGDGSPAKVSQKEYDWWVSMTAAVQDFRQSAAQYMIGQTVRVSEGPFAGMLGELIGVSGNKLKITLSGAQNSLTITTDKSTVSSSFAA